MTQNVPETLATDAPAEQIQGVLSVLLNMAPMISSMSGQSLPPEALDKIRGFIAAAVVPGAVATIAITLPSGQTALFKLKLT